MSFFNINTSRFNIITNSKVYCIIKYFIYKLNKKDMLMRMKTTCFNNISGNKEIFKHLKEGQDEELRCEIQNSVFYDEDRVPLIEEDITSEECQEYYLKNFGVFICNDEGQAIGYGQVIFSKGIYTIVNLGIVDDYRQQGYGELLVKYLIEFCYKKSIEKIYIRVEKNNSKALSLYNKIGFKRYKSIVIWFRDIELF